MATTRCPGDGADDGGAPAAVQVNWLRFMRVKSSPVVGRLTAARKQAADAAGITKTGSACWNAEHFQSCAQRSATTVASREGLASWAAKAGRITRWGSKNADPTRQVALAASWMAVFGGPTSTQLATQLLRLAIAKTIE